MGFIPTDEHDRIPERKERIDYNEIDASLANRIESVLHEWFADKPIKEESQWFKIGNNGSLTVNRYDGHWTSFEDDAKGKGLTSLYAWRYGVTLKEAGEDLNDQASIVQFRKPVAKPKKAPEPPQWEHSELPPIATPDEHFELGKADHVARYRDREGKAVGVVLRWDATEERPSKEIRPMSWVQMHNKESPEWKWCHFAEPRPLYRGERINAEPSKPILIVEGEKTAEAAEKLLTGFVVVSWPQGSSGVHRADWSGLDEREVVIWPDADNAGRKAAAAIQSSIGAGVIVDTDDFADKSDIADYVASGKGADWLLDQIQQVRGNYPSIEIGMESMARNFEDAKAQRPDVIIEGLIYAKSKLLIGAVAKAGKSHFTMGLVKALCNGEQFLKWRPQKRLKVLYVDFELHKWELSERVGSAFHWMVPDNMGRLSLRSFGDIRNPKALSAALRRAKAGRFDVIVLDCLYKFNDAEDENDNSAMQGICNWLDSMIEEFDVTPIIIHHFGKGAQSGKSTIDRFRGASSLVGDMDAILSLTAHEDDNHLIIDTEVRSFAPTDGFVAIWDYPHFKIADAKDATKHAKPGAARKVADSEILGVLPVGKDNARHFMNLGCDLKKRTFDDRIKQIEGAFVVKKANFSGKQENAYYRL